MSDGGKGSTQRPTDYEKYGSNYDAIFRKKPDQPSLPDIDKNKYKLTCPHCFVDRFKAPCPNLSQCKFQTYALLSPAQEKK